MGVEKTIIKEGNGADYPKKGDNVAMEYTGWLFEPSKEDKKGLK
jgi:FK506-binding protein 1